MAEDRQRLVVVDDEPLLRTLIGDVGRMAGWRVDETDDPDVFLRLCAEGVDVAFIDLRMPGVDGVRLLHALSQTPHPPCVVPMSGLDAGILSAARHLAEALGLNVVGILEKPFRVEGVLSLLRRPRPARKPSTLVPPPSVDPAEVTDVVTQGRLDVHFQPQVSLTDGSVVGAEALVRWRHPTLGFVPPDAFLPVVEEHGLMPELSSHVLRASVRALSRMRAEVPWLSLAVNVTASVLSRPGFLELALDLLREAALPFEALKLEVTENGLVDDSVNALDVLVRIRMAGMGLSIDDFGTGYSNLVQTRRVPASELKVDRSFVLGLAESARAATLVHSVVRLGRELGMRVIAEGVETKEIARLLSEMGCDAGQGYLWAPAMPIDDFLEFCEARRERGTREFW